MPESIQQPVLRRQPELENKEIRRIALSVKNRR
jgi:hypothetical protein